jgi:hypothetical protein
LGSDPGVDPGVALTEHGCAYRRAVEDAFTARGVTLRVTLQMGSIGALLGCVREGLGVAIVPAAALGKQERPLAVREIADLPLSIGVGLVTRAQIAEPSALVQIVREHVRTRLRSAAAPQRAQPRNMIYHVADLHAVPCDPRREVFHVRTNLRIRSLPGVGIGDPRRLR